MNSDLVSVIIPTYKRPEFLEAAIKSVLEQTYEPLELIVVDDNGEGTAGQLQTAAVIEKFNDRRLNYHIQKENAGVCTARNTGIALSKGDYVALLDNDDLFLPQKIEKQVQFLKQQSQRTAGCGTWYKRFYENGTEFEFCPPDSANVVKSLIKHEVSYAAGSTVLLKRFVFDDVGMFDRSYIVLEDPEFLLRVALKYDFRIVEEQLTRIRCRDKSVNAELQEKMQLKLLEQYRNVIKELPGKEARGVYFKNYFYISKKYIQTRNYAKAFSYFLKCGNPVRYLFLLITSAAEYMARSAKIKGKHMRRDAE